MCFVFLVISEENNGRKRFADRSQIYRRRKKDNLRKCSLTERWCKESGIMQVFCGTTFDADLSARGKKEEGCGRVLSK